MPNYIKDTYEEWTAKMKEINRLVKSATPSVPFLEGKQFSTAGTEEFPRPSDEEIKIVQPLFMRFCGAFLWIARMCMHDVMFSASQHAHVRACVPPSDDMSTLEWPSEPLPEASGR